MNTSTFAEISIKFTKGKFRVGLISFSGIIQPVYRASVPIAHPFRGEVFHGEVYIAPKAMKTLRHEGLSYNLRGHLQCRRATFPRLLPRYLQTAAHPAPATGNSSGSHP